LLQPFVWVEPVPSVAARQTAPVWAQPVLDLFPQPNGAAYADGLAKWSGEVSRPSQLDAGSVRLDQAIGSRVTLFTRYSESPSSTEFGTNSVNALDLGARSVTAGLTLRARPDLVFDVRFNYSDSNASSLWQQNPPLAACALGSVVDHLFPEQTTCNYLLRLTLAGAGEVVAGPEGTRSQSQIQAAQTGNWNVRSHSLQFGIDYRRLSAVRRDGATLFSLLASNVSDLTNTANLWLDSSTPQFLTAKEEEVALFAADTWQIGSRLTATYGVRWELSPAPTPGATSATYFDAATGSLVPLQQALWHSHYGNIAPRIGIAYRLNKRGDTVVRAGGGFYYDSSLSLATDLVNDGPLNVSMYRSGRNAPFPALLEFGFLPNLRLPLVKQWNLSVEHAFDDHDVLSLGYVGSFGQSLIRREVGGEGSTATEILVLATNDGSSIYHSLQAQYRRRLSRGWQAIASYAWSHSIDNSSSDGGLYWAGSGLSPNNDRASSDFDVRHVATIGFSYQWKGWTLDGLLRARTGFPINVLDEEQYMGISFENVFRPNYVGGQPLWTADPNLPGGRALNPAAFVAAPLNVQGNFGRNGITGFGMNQLDLSVRHEWVFTEHRAIQVRVEAFNALNHANFADPIPYLSSPLFGQSSSMLNMMLGTGSPGSGLAPIFQSGGARSLQMMLQFRF
jgi:hypothetical protein